MSQNGALISYLALSVGGSALHIWPSAVSRSLFCRAGTGLAAGVVAALCRTHSREPVVCTHLTRPSTCPSQSWVVPSTAALEISLSLRSTCPSVVAAAALPRLWVVSRARHRPTPTADPRCLGTPPACDRESRDPAFQPTAHSACMDPPLPPPHAPGSQVAAHVRGVVEAHARFLQLNFFITKVRLYVAA